MSKLTHAHEIEVRRAIRDAIGLDPLLSNRKLVEILNERFTHSFDPRYIQKLRKKVDGETTPRLDREKITFRLKSIRETFRVARENLLTIAYGKITPFGNSVKDVDRISAWRSIAQLEKLLLDAEIDLHIYDKDLPEGVNQDFRSRPVPAEIWLGIIQTGRMWRLPTDLTRKIEVQEPVTVEVKEVPKEEPKAPQPQAQPQNNGPKYNPTDLIPADPEFRVS